MYLHGMSSGDFAPALEEFFGSAAGLSASVITRLTTQWQDEQRAFAERACPTVTTCTCGPTASTSTSASKRPACAPWSSSASGPMAPRNWSPSPTATGSRPSPGPTCCATSSAGACGPRWSPSATARWGSGPRSHVWPETPKQRCWVHKVANVPQRAAEVDRSRPPSGCWPRSATPKTATTPCAAIDAFATSSRPSGPRRPPRSSTTSSAARLLRLPGRALDPPQDHQPDRVDLRHRAAAHQGHQRPGLTSRRAGHGVQAHRGRPGPLAGRQRPPPRRPRPGRRQVREGGDRRTRNSRIRKPPRDQR